MPDSHSSALRAEIERATRAKASIPFDRFMELVLYHPEHGYYATHGAPASRGGDFLTAPEVAPFFGACVAAWVERIWDELGRPTFHIVEVGAGRGALAQALLAAVPSRLAEVLNIHLVERGAAPRRAAELVFAGHPRVGIYESIDALPLKLGQGAFIANELFDNLPVRRLMRADGWKEIRVALERGRIRERLEPAPPELVAAAAAEGLSLEEGQSCEVRPGAVPLLSQVLDRFDAGGLLVFDYGGESGEVAGDLAPQGTLAAYREHARQVDLYAALGDQDITAHVNFTPLRAAAEALGYTPTRLESQASFLLRHGLAERLTEATQQEGDELQRLRLLQWAKRLYHPEAMGESFRVLSATKRH